MTACTGQSRLIEATESMAAPDRGDFAFMKGEASGFWSSRPSGKIIPEKTAAMKAQLAGSR